MCRLFDIICRSGHGDLIPNIYGFLSPSRWTLAGQAHQQLLPSWKECRTYLSALASWIKVLIGNAAANEAAATEAEAAEAEAAERAAAETATPETEAAERAAAGAASEETHLTAAAATAVTAAAAASVTRVEQGGIEGSLHTATAATSTSGDEEETGSFAFFTLTWLLKGLFDDAPWPGPPSDGPGQLNLQRLAVSSAASSHAARLLVLVFLARVELSIINLGLGVLPSKRKSSRESKHHAKKMPAAARSSSGCDQIQNRRRRDGAINSSSAPCHSSFRDADSPTPDGEGDVEGGSSGEGGDAEGRSCTGEMGDAEAGGGTGEGRRGTAGNGRMREGRGVDGDGCTGQGGGSDSIGSSGELVGSDEICCSREEGGRAGGCSGKGRGSDSIGSCGPGGGSHALSGSRRAGEGEGGGCNQKQGGGGGEGCTREGRTADDGDGRTGRGWGVSGTGGAKERGEAEGNVHIEEGRGLDLDGLFSDGGFQIDAGSCVLESGVGVSRGDGRDGRAKSGAGGKPVALQSITEASSSSSSNGSTPAASRSDVSPLDDKQQLCRPYLISGIEHESSADLLGAAVRHALIFHRILVVWNYRPAFRHSTTAGAAAAAAGPGPVAAAAAGAGAGSPAAKFLDPDLPKSLSLLLQEGLPPAVADHMQFISRRWPAEMLEQCEAPAAASDQTKLLQHLLLLMKLLMAEVPSPVGCNSPACVDLSEDSEHEGSNRRCAGCKVACYCSEACQKAHWKEHRGACKRLQEGT